MGVDLNTWRQRIGQHAGNMLDCKRKTGYSSGWMRTNWLTFDVKKYLLLCALLLVLCGDVEENPGPPQHFPIRGNKHQGDEIFSEESRGKQCVPCCLSFFLNIMTCPLNMNVWSASDLDKVLFVGDYIYKYSKHTMKLQAEYLLVSDLPKYVTIENRAFSWSIQKTYFGNISDAFVGVHPIVPLETALETSLAMYRFAIFVCKGNALGITHFEEQYIIFDSHSRNEQGFCCSNGTSIAIKKNSIPEVSVHIRNLIQSLSSDTNSLNEQFELYGLVIREIAKSSVTRYSRKGTIVCQIPNDILCERIQEKAKETTSNVCCNAETENTNTSNFKDVPEIVIPTSRRRMLNNPIRSTASKPKQKKCQHASKDLIDSFHKITSKGPEYVCTSCSQVYFKHSVMKMNAQKYESSFIKDCVKGLKSVNDLEYICRQCDDYLKGKKTPPCSIGNKLSFPEIPDELKNLTQLEQLLISPRIPFMQIRELARGGQFKLKGNVVNVPADVNKTVRLIPRNMNENETIPVKFKRSLSFKSYLAFEQVRPDKIIEAAKWLVNHSKLFQNEGITVNESWTNDSQCDECLMDGALDDNSSQSSGTVDDEISEDTEMQKEAGNMDTLLHPADFREFNRILNVAPAEGNSPLGMFQDCFSEYLSFPTLYCGQPRCDNNKRIRPLHYSTICKWELRNVDRRVSQNVTNIFYKLKRVQIKQITDKVSLAMRKCKLKGKKVTVGDLLCENSVNKILKLDEGYKVLRTLRGSPPYWERAKKDIFAMIRQLGIPTWFCSFSSAETKWLPLLHSLGKLVDKRDYTCTELQNMSWNEKCRLIKSDPVTCSRYFDHKVQTFLNNVLKHKDNPIGNVKDFFYRVEFQQRGSPHIHMLIWIDGAPTTWTHTHEQVAEFIHAYVTCKKNEEISDFVNYQTHRHAHTCLMKSKRICRFGFPLPPINKTMILQGLKRDSVEYEKASQNYTKIVSALEDMKLGTETPIEFKQFLASLDLTCSDYILALKSSVEEGHSRVFLKRNTSEIRVNNYNETLLKCWEANMDIQYILDPYACAAYIVSYISKGQRGMSELLRRACNEAKKCDSDIRQQVRRVGNVFLNHIEIGAQEAVYILLQMPLRKATREFVFINTNVENERVVLIKPNSVLNEMPANSTSVETDNNIKRYMRRPVTMENYSLAEFIAYFNIKFSKNKKDDLYNMNSKGELLEENYDLDNTDNPYTDMDNRDDNFEEVHFSRDGSSLSRRKVPRIIYSVGFNQDHDTENYYRELLMLYIPWRNENAILKGSNSFEERYNICQQDVEKVRRKFVHVNAVNLAEIEREITFEDDINCSITPLQHNEEQDMIDGTRTAQEYGCFNPGENVENNYDLGTDLGIGRKPVCCHDEQLSGEMLDTEYRKLVQSLNQKQKLFFYHVIHTVKTTNKPVYNFLSGGAGVGKSVLLQALHQALLKYFSKKLGENPDTCHVLVCAPTGKAAYNVGGLTIHSAFNIPADQGYKFRPLDMQQLCSYQMKYKSLKMIFIDEISMVGKRMLNFINLRLQEIMGSVTPFGGVSVIAFGDLFQLKPVLDAWIFSSGSSADNELEILGPSLWKDMFSLYELTEIMRQRDDLRFAQLLNRLREGLQLPEDVRLLQERDQDNDSEITLKMPHLFTTRKEVEDFNTQVFHAAAPREKTTVKAIDSVAGDFPSDYKEKILSKIPLDISKTKGLPKFLNLAEGLPGELSINIDVSDGLTNGSPCIIKKLDFRVYGSDRCSIVWVLFDNLDIGKKCRRQFSHLYKQGIHSSWTPILELTRKFQYNYYNPFQITRRQFPVIMASAKTIHKAQGSTLLKAVVHLGSKKIDHIYYVALSRVRSLSSLYLHGFKEENIKVSSAVMEEMYRLRNQAQVQLSIPDLSDSIGLLIVYHNARSLHKHINDIRNDFVLNSADVLAFSETRLKKTESSMPYNLVGYNLYRLDDETDITESRPYHGMAVYHKPAVSFRNISFSGVEVILGNLIYKNTELLLCFIYFPPKISMLHNIKSFFEKLSCDSHGFQMPTIIMGDFNISTTIVSDFVLKKYSLRQIVQEYTTDYGTSIDHIYTNINADSISKWGVLESYYSDHKPIFIKLHQYS